MWVLSSKSEKQLEGVHPDLVSVVKGALEISPYDFGITEGERSVEKQKENIKKGVSTTMKTLHFKQEDGFVHAVDVVVYINGKVTWDVKYYRKVIQAFFTVAIQQEVQIESGGLWESFVDGPHFQLGKSYR